MDNAQIITIGNELLIGDTVNTNASWIGRFLTENGFSVKQVFTLPDEYNLVKKRVENSIKNCALTIVTGGLGPTHDDITKKIVADIFDAEMVMDEDVLDHIKKIFERRDFVFSKSNADQALVPENCTVLFNTQGTAPGMWFEHKGNGLAVLPGVPFEMKYLMENGVKPQIDRFFPKRDVWATRYYKTAGVPESTLSDDVVGDLTEYLNNGVSVAYLPGAAGVTIRISASGESRKSAGKKLDKLSDVLHQKAGPVIYGEGRDCELAAVIGELLVEKELTIATAESCTGGMIANTITDVSGSSRYMLGGIIAYANDVKTGQLGVDQNILENDGAVSKNVALHMAEGVADKMKASIGISTTGIAGPTGGTEEKPVGTVWMGFWFDGVRFALKANFTNDRHINKLRTEMVVLETIRRHLLGLESYPYQLNPQR